MRFKKKVHFARIFPICSEKGSGLPERDPDRKFKGRCVVQGNDVKDENSHAAIFQELSSSPATLEAAKSVDAYGCVKGNGAQQCDAQHAYVQSSSRKFYIELASKITKWSGLLRPIALELIGVIHTQPFPA